jgi:hypothetical protein
MTDVEIITVRRAADDSGWHVRFSIGSNEQSAWVESEGYLDREYLKDALADKFGLKRPRTFYVDDLVVGQPIAPKTEPSSPPRLAEFAFSLLAPKKSLSPQLGDLQEVFELNVARFGKSRARILYWAQVLRAVGPGVWRRVKKLGFIGILIDYGRSKLGF